MYGERSIYILVMKGSKSCLIFGIDCSFLLNDLYKRVRAGRGVAEYILVILFGRGVVSLTE